MNIITSLLFSGFLLFQPFHSYADLYVLECSDTENKTHTIRNDPNNGNNLIIDGELYRFSTESIIGNKKVSVFSSDANNILNVILIVDPLTNNGDVYYIIYLDPSSNRNLDSTKVNIHCKI